MILSSTEEANTSQHVIVVLKNKEHNKKVNVFVFIPDLDHQDHQPMHILFR